MNQQTLFAFTVPQARVEFTRSEHLESVNQEEPAKKRKKTNLDRAAAAAKKRKKTIYRWKDHESTDSKTLKKPGRPNKLDTGTVLRLVEITQSVIDQLGNIHVPLMTTILQSALDDMKISKRVSKSWFYRFFKTMGLSYLPVPKKFRVEAEKALAVGDKGVARRRRPVGQFGEACTGR